MKFKAGNRIGKKSDFDHAIVLCARLAGVSIQQIVDLIVDFHTQPSLMVQKEIMDSEQ